MTLPRRLLLVAGLAAAVATACTRQISDKNLVLVDPGEAQRLVTRSGGLLGLVSREGAWVDPRSARDYQDGHIPGAVNLPFQDVSSGYKRFEGYDVVVVYGTDHVDARADAMSKRLLELGLKDVRTLRGGMRAWIEAGYPIVTGSEPGEPVKAP